MSGKVKVKCARCGKHFKSSNAKATLCDECAARERQARASAKVNPARPAAAVATAAPRIVGPGAGILVPGMARQVEAPVETSPHGAAHPGEQRGGEQRGPEREGGHGPHTGQPGHGPGGHGAAAMGRPGKGQPKPKAERPPKPPREPKPVKPPTPPFELTDDQRARVEARYLELATPVEFDGIRTQIAAELSIPKTAVKRAVTDLRARTGMPSWWELQAYKGTAEDLERIRAIYVPLLPVPAVGIHRQIATDLGLEASTVYHGIRHVRAEMHLPQYNPPEAHAGDAPAETRAEAAADASAEAPDDAAATG
jgi:hypothetical protein